MEARGCVGWVGGVSLHDKVVRAFAHVLLGDVLHTESPGMCGYVGTSAVAALLPRVWRGPPFGHET